MKKMRINTFSQLYLWSHDKPAFFINYPTHSTAELDHQILTLVTFKPFQKQLYAGTVNDNIIYCSAAQNHYLILWLSDTVLFNTYYSPPHPALPVGSWLVRNMLPYTNLGCSQLYKFQALNKKHSGGQ